MNCTVTENIGNITKCEIETKNGKTGGTFHSTVLTDLSRNTVTALLYTEKQRNLQLLMEFKDVDVCGLLNGSSVRMFSRAVLMFKDLLASKGEIPKKCPILKGTKIAFDMVNFDTKTFPFIPVMSFKLVILGSLNDIPNSLVLNVTGQVVNNRRAARL